MFGMQLWLGAVTLLWLHVGCHGYYQYQTAIPNGQNVPHPCKPNYIWHGVGHQNPGGGGVRNPFGLDFARLGLKWSVELCGLDSDGDGKTNGQELGDPHCVWSAGTLPSRTDNITHPGVCEPWGSEHCSGKNSWVSCDTDEFHCDAVKAPDVRNITLRYPRTKVPTAETSYMCYVFDLPSDQTYHLIANQPVIDNPNVMHHIGILGCADDAALMDHVEVCDNMGNLNCTELIGIWTLGMAGECLHPLAGFRIGQGGYKRVALQFHWTNKHHVDSWYDSSGLTLYYTPKLRPNDAGVTIIGQNNLYIPPGVASLTINGSCSSHCTSTYMKGDMNIIAILNHMHYLGIGGNVEQIRDGHVIRDLSPDHPYSYDSPHVHYYEQPVVVRPGDELKMVCQFSSLSKDVTTVSGPGSYNEMCFGLITFYPASSLSQMNINCIQHDKVDYCDFQDPAHSCRPGDVFNTSHPDTKAMLQDVSEHCLTYIHCNKECPPVIARYREANRCLSGPYWDMFKTKVMTGTNVDLIKFVVAVDICDNAAALSRLQSSTSLSPHVHNCSQPAQTSPLVQTTPPAQLLLGGDQPQSPLSPLGAFIQLARELGTRPLLQNIIFNNGK